MISKVLWHKCYLSSCICNKLVYSITIARLAVCYNSICISLGSRSLRWRHNGYDSVSNHQPHNCLLNRLFGCWSKKTSKLRVTCLYVGNSPGTGEFPAQMASNADNVSIWWRHHVPRTVSLLVWVNGMEVLTDEMKCKFNVRRVNCTIVYNSCISM